MFNKDLVLMENVAVYCETYEEAVTFCKWAKKEGNVDFSKNGPIVGDRYYIVANNIAADKTFINQIGTYIVRSYKDVLSEPSHILRCFMQPNNKCESCQHEYKKKEEKLYGAGDEFFDIDNYQFKLIKHGKRLLLLYLGDNSLFTAVWEDEKISLKEICETWVTLKPVEK